MYVVVTTASALVIGTGIGLLTEFAIDWFYDLHRIQHPDSQRILGFFFIVFGSFGAWFARFWFDFWRG